MAVFVSRITNHIRWVKERAHKLDVKWCSLTMQPAGTKAHNPETLLSASAVILKRNWRIHPSKVLLLAWFPSLCMDVIALLILSMFLPFHWQFSWELNAAGSGIFWRFEAGCLESASITVYKPVPNFCCAVIGEWTRVNFYVNLERCFCSTAFVVHFSVSPSSFISARSRPVSAVKRGSVITRAVDQCSFHPAPSLPWLNPS